MANNPFDQFDAPASAAAGSGNPFDQFDGGASKPAEAPSFTGSFSRGLKRTIPETKSLLAGAGAAVAGAVGADDVRDSLLSTYQDIQTNQVEPLANKSGFIDAVTGNGSLRDWAGDTLGNFAGQALQSVAAGAVGATLGSVVPGAGTVAGGIGGLVAKAGAKDMVEGAVARMVAKGVADGVARKQVLAQLGGAAAATTGLNVGQEVGIGFTGRAEDAKAAGQDLTQQDALRAIGWGVPAGLVDTAAEALTGKLVGEGISSAPRMLTRVAKGAGVGAVTEGGTEGVQAVMERAGAGQEMTGEQAYKDYIENVAAGALGGAVPGAAGGLRRQQPNTPPGAPPVHAPAAKAPDPGIPDPSIATQPGPLVRAAQTLATPPGAAEPAPAPVSTPAAPVEPTAVDGAPVAPATASTPAPAASPGEPLPVFDRALQLLAAAGKVSAGELGKQLKLSKDQTVALMDELQARGIVSGKDSRGQRRLLTNPATGEIIDPKAAEAATKRADAKAAEQKLVEFVRTNDPSVMGSPPAAPAAAPQADPAAFQAKMEERRTAALTRAQRPDPAASALSAAAASAFDTGAADLVQQQRVQSEQKQAEQQAIAESDRAAKEAARAQKEQITRQQQMVKQQQLDAATPDEADIRAVLASEMEQRGRVNVLKIARQMGVKPRVVEALRVEMAQARKRGEPMIPEAPVIDAEFTDVTEQPQQRALPAPDQRPAQMRAVQQADAQTSRLKAEMASSSQGLAASSVPGTAARLSDRQTQATSVPTPSARSDGQVAAPESQAPSGDSAYDTSADVLDSDITPPSGGAFSLRGAAEQAAKSTPGGKVFEVDGGYVVRTPRANSSETSNSSFSQAPATAAQGDRVKIATRFGTSVYVNRADLEGDAKRMRYFTSTGKPAGVIVRDNLDPTGEKLAESNREDESNPLFDVITTKQGNVFATEAAAARERNRRGLQETYDITPAGGGFVLKRKAAAPTEPAPVAAAQTATEPTNQEQSNGEGKGQGQDGRQRQGRREALLNQQAEAAGPQGPAAADNAKPEKPSSTMQRQRMPRSDAVAEVQRQLGVTKKRATEIVGEIRSEAKNLDGVTYNLKPGIVQTADVQAAIERERAAKTDLGKQKVSLPEPAATAIATHKDPGQPAEPVTAPVIADAIKTSAAKTPLNLKEARAWLLERVDEALKGAPKSGANVTVSDPRTEDGRKVRDVSTDVVDPVSGASRPRLRVVEIKVADSGSTYNIMHGNKVLDRQDGSLRFAILTAENLLLASKWQPTGGPAGSWDFTGSAPADFVTFDVPGDGKFKVLNTRENLEAFRAKVVASSGFKDERKRTAAAPMAKSEAWTVINSFLEDAEFGNAYTYSNAVDKPLRYALDSRPAGATEDGVVAYAVADDVEIAGFKMWVGRMVTAVQKTRGTWSVVEPKTGRVLASGNTRDAAIGTARALAKKHGDKWVAEKIKSEASNRTEAQREQDWLKANAPDVYALVNGEEEQEAVPVAKAANPQQQAVQPAPAQPQDETAKPAKANDVDARYEHLLSLKSTRLMDKHSDGRALYEVTLSMEQRKALQDSRGQFNRSVSFELKTKEEVTGNKYATGYVLIDRREQNANRAALEAKARPVDKKAITAEDVASAVSAANYNHKGISFSVAAKHAEQVSAKLKKAGVPGWAVDMAIQAGKDQAARLRPGDAAKVAAAPIIESLRKNGFIKAEAAQTTSPTLAEAKKNEPLTEWALQGFIKIAADSVQTLRPVDVERVIRETPAQHRQAVAEYIKKNSYGALDLEVDDVARELGVTMTPVAPDLKGFKLEQTDSAAFDLVDGNMRVSVVPMADGKFQASYRGAKSSPHLQSKQAAIDWAAGYRDEAKRLAAPASSVQGQKNMAARGGRIATLMAMNGRLRKLDPDSAWLDSNIEQADDLDALQDQISEALTKAERGKQPTNALRSELEQMSGAELRVVFDRMSLAGARMTHIERVEALMAEDEAAVRAAMAAVQPEATTGPADAKGERKFYVTMIRDSKVARIAGPFDTKEEADAILPAARDKAKEVDPRAVFDAFGVSAVTMEEHKPAALNEQLGIGKKAPSSKPAAADNLPTKFISSYQGDADYSVYIRRIGKDVRVGYDKDGNFKNILSEITEDEKASARASVERFVREEAAKEIKFLEERGIDIPAELRAKAGQVEAAAAPTIPEGYKPTGEPYYVGKDLVQGYAKFPQGERVKLASGIQGVVTGHIGKGPILTRAMVKFDNGTESGVDERELVAVAAAKQDDDAPTMTRPEARELMFWQDMGQKDGEKSHRLTFYTSKDDAESKRGSMTYGKITKDQGSSKWFVEDGDSFTSLADAKRQATEMALDRAEREGFIAKDAPAKQEAQAKAPAKTTEKGERTPEEAYEWAVKNRPYSIAVGMQGDVPIAFQQRKMAQSRLDQAPPSKRDSYTIVGIGDGAARRFYVVPTLEKYLEQQGAQAKPPQAADFPDAASYHAAVAAYRAANPATPAAPKQDRRAEIRRELAALQQNYEKRMNRADGAVPPAIKADALAGIARKMDKLTAELKALDEAKATPAKPDAITDFGEKLPPARRAMAAKLDEALTDADIANRPLSEIWPIAENEAIEDTFAAAVAHAARAEIPAKPRKGYKVTQWVAKVKIMRDLAASLVSGRTDRDTFISAANKRAATVPSLAGYDLRDWISKVLLLEQIDRSQWKRISEVESRPDMKVKRGDAWVSAPQLRIVIDDKPHYLNGDAGATDPATVDGNMAGILGLMAKDAQSKALRFEIRGSGGRFYIAKKDDPEIRQLMTFTSVEDARKAIIEQYDSLVAAWQAIKDRDNITERDLRGEENRPRVGKDHRKGRDVKPEDFQEQFGFKGGEFGKWVQQGKGDKDRQTFLNNAYDSLMDLAELVGIPPRAISLNGTLGIAFGSRGSGWASAHFEPSNLVINLTKTRGAGALAHEWFHALDNYFSRLRGGEVKFTGSNSQYKNDNYITHNPEPLMVRKDGSMRYAPMTRGKLEATHAARKHLTDAFNPDNWKVDPKHREGVRPEVEARFADLVQALNDSPMTKRSAKLDKGKSNYWSSTLERAARAFEVHVIARLAEQGNHNDFLANVNQFDEMAGKGEDRYPYLLPGEVKPIADAFDALLNTVQTRTEPSGSVAMFAKGAAPGWDRNTVLEGWRELATKPDSFIYPTSEAIALEDIAAEVYPDLAIAQEVDELYTLTLPEQWVVKNAAGKVARVFKSKAKADVYAADTGGKVVYQEPTQGALVQHPDNEDHWFLSVADWKPGQDGARVYSVVLNWAHNNGKVLVPDPDHLTPINEYRRTEQMVASALRYGTTAHMRPDESQRVPWINEPTSKANNDANVDALLRRSYENGIEVLPELLEVDYDPTDTTPLEGDKDWTYGRFRDRITGVDRTAEIVRLVGTAGPRERGIGRTTLARIAHTLALLRGDRRAGRDAVLATDVPARPASAWSLIRRFIYGKDDAQQQSRRLTKLQLEKLLGPAARALKAARPGLEVIFVANHAELQAHPDARDIVQQSDYDTTVQAAINGDRTKVFFIAESIRSPRQALKLFAHEMVGHYSMEQMLGARLFTELRDRILALRDAGKWPEVFAEVTRRYERNADGTFRALDDDTFAAEAIAVFAEKNIQTSILQRALNAMRGWLRKFFPQLNLSQGELRQMLWEAGQYLEGKPYRPDVAARALGQRTPKTAQEAMARHAFGKDGGSVDAMTPHARAVSEIVAAMQSHDGEFGLRVIDGTATVGDMLAPSTVWKNGEPTSRKLRGTSSAEVRRSDERSVESALEALGIGKKGANGYYFGKTVALIKGRRVGRGEDAGESIIADAEVIGVWQKETKGNSDVMPNETSDTRQAPPREGLGASGASFAKAGTMVDRLQDLINPKDTTLLQRIKNKLSDWRPAALGALQLRHLGELAEDILPPVATYSQVVQRMATMRNELQELGHDVVDAGMKYQGANPEEAKKLFRMLHDATLAGVDPAEAHKPLQMMDAHYRENVDVTPENVRAFLQTMRGQAKLNPGSAVVYINRAKEARKLLNQERRRAQSHREMSPKFARLSADAKKLWVQMRDAYRTQSAEYEKALISRIESLDFDKAQKAGQIARMRLMFESARVPFYIPLARWGEYWVSGTNADGQREFYMQESAQAQQRVRKELADSGYKEIAHGVKLDTVRAQDGASASFMAEMDEMLKKSGAPDKIRDEAFQLYLRSLPDLSIRQNFIHRQGTPGYSQDALRALAGHIFHGSFQIARLRYSHELEAILTEAESMAKDMSKADDPAANAAGNIVNELKKRHEWVMNPQDNPVVNKISSVGFVYYLGLTPAAALVNLLQTPMVALPVLAGKHKVGDVTRELWRAMKQSLGTYGHMQKQLEGEELEAHTEFGKRGVFDKTQSANLAGISESDTHAYSPRWHKTMSVISHLFHKGEIFNREATAMAAYRLERAAGAGHLEAIEAADRAVHESHFDYSNANRARYMQSGAAKVLLMFRQYSLAVTWLLCRNLWQSMKGMDAQTRTEARRKLAGVLGMTAIFSGTLGLPLLGTVGGVMNALAAAFGDDDEPWDWETEFRAFMRDMLGDTGAEAVLNGPVQALTGVGIASRVSMGDLWFREPDRELEGRAWSNYLFEQAAGPMGGLITNFFRGQQLMSEGQVWRGVETIMPKAIKDAMKSVRYLDEGVNNLRGDAIVADLNVFESLAQIAGFSPASVSDAYDTARDIKNYEQAILSRRSRLMDAFALAWRLGDTDAREEILVKMRKFSQTYPELAITGDSIKRSLTARARASAQADGGVIVDKRIRARLEAQLG